MCVQYRNGWVNTYHEAELEALFVQEGFVCTEKRTWSTEGGDERIFVFQNSNRAALEEQTR